MGGKERKRGWNGAEKGGILWRIKSPASRLVEQGKRCVLGRIKSPASAYPYRKPFPHQPRLSAPPAFLSLPHAVFQRPPHIIRAASGCL